MNKITYHIEGHITRTDNDSGIHGLCVEVWEQDACDNDFLGSDFTNNDGSFSVWFSATQFKEPFEGNPEVFLIIKDCECRIIHDTRDEVCICYVDETHTINVQLAPEVLWWHQRCSSWKCPEDPLIPKKVIDEIGEALELLANSERRVDSEDGTQFPNPLKWEGSRVLTCLERTTPLLRCFDHVISDACQTLQGDLDASARYREILELLCSEHETVCCGESPGIYEQFLEDVFAESWHPDKQPPPCCESNDDHCLPAPECPPGQVEPPCPCKESIVEFDKSAVLLMAALHLSCGHEVTAKRYLLTLLNQLCRFEFLGALHRAAVGASCGDDRSLKHFQNLVNVLIKQCETGFCCCETCLDEALASCLHDMVAVWSSITCYRVTEVKPPRACPGDKVVICGSGFGQVPGQVVFQPKNGLGTGISVTADSWCDNRIDVVVPQGAGCGLTLLLPFDTVKFCSRYLEYRPTGCMEDEFEGTSAEILKFLVKDHVTNECLHPGEPLKIRWKTCAADHVRVEILNRKTGAVIAVQDPADARGGWDFTATNFSSTTEILVRITARGQCIPVIVTRELFLVFQNPPNLVVDGMEVTQAIQYYRANLHLTDSSDRGPDNSLRLVTNKTAWIRVYLRSGQIPGFDGGALENVDGTLTVERRVGGIWNQVATIASQNGPINAQDGFVNYDTERGNIANSLNFIVPAAQMNGLLRLRVNVASPYPQCPGNTATGQTTVDVNLQQTLNAAFITIGYNGPNSTNTGNLLLPAPTLAQCQAETSWTMTTYPVSGAPNVRIAGTFVTNTPLNDPRSCPGCCSPNWQPLLQQVAALVVADQAAFPGGNWVYYGIVNNGIPVTVPGCNAWGATGGLAGSPVTYAHEIGHQFGLSHARCGNAGDGNANYPVYEPYDLPVDVPATPIANTNWTMASIGEYGLDINNGNIANPQNAEDFMSYCGPRWISLYTHNYLVNRPALSPQVIPTGSGAATNRVIEDDTPGFARDTQRLRPLINIMGFAQDDIFTVANVARLETRYLVATGHPTRFTAELLQGGQVIASDPLYAFVSEGSCGSCSDRCDDNSLPLFFRAMLDDLALGESLRIVDNQGKVVWERRCPKTGPNLSRATASTDEYRESVVVEWHLEVDPEAISEVWLRWSNDDGKTWRALSVGITESAVTLLPENLPTGKVLFQVMAHDGFSTVTCTTNSVELPARPPQVTILYPTASSRVYSERQLHLRGVASVFEGSAIPDDAYHWYLENELIARGSDVWVENPGLGSREVRLEVSFREEVGSTSTTFEVL
jgi:hypothetical protein